MDLHNCITSLDHIGQDLNDQLGRISPDRTVLANISGKGYHCEACCYAYLSFFTVKIHSSPVKEKN